MSEEVEEKVVFKTHQDCELPSQKLRRQILNRLSEDYAMEMVKSELDEKRFFAEFDGDFTLTHWVWGKSGRPKVTVYIMPQDVWLDEMNRAKNGDD